MFTGYYLLHGNRSCINNCTHVFIAITHIQKVKHVFYTTLMYFSAESLINCEGSNCTTNSSTTTSCPNCTNPLTTSTITSTTAYSTDSSSVELDEFFTDSNVQNSMDSYDNSTEIDDFYNTTGPAPAVNCSTIACPFPTEVNCSLDSIQVPKNSTDGCCIETYR